MLRLHLGSRPLPVKLLLLAWAGYLVACVNINVTSPIQPTSTPAASETVESTAAFVAQPAGPSVVVLWNEVMLAAVRSGPPRPTVIARSLFMVHAAIYDA